VRLWQSFIPKRKEIKDEVGNDLFSMQVYDKGFDFRNFNLDAKFDKWAALEVNHLNELPQGMESYNLPGGLYAVFIHKGPASEGERTFRHIFEVWLPQSGYVIDDRPHFEILGEKYKNNDPASEEEVWIPVKLT
jgi:AraC family transcriptional regulator